MTKIYACLIGNWVCLNDDPKCKMGPNQVSPLVWWEENAYLYAPLTRRSPDTFYEFPYLNILYIYGNRLQNQSLSRSDSVVTSPGKS